MTLRILSDRPTLAAEQPNTRQIAVRITAPAASKAEQTPLSIAFALDRSSSMTGQRIRLSRLAIRKAARLLGPTDSTALTTFSSHAQTIMELRQVTELTKEDLRNRLSMVDAKGGTNLFAGWFQASQELAEAQGQIARVLLLSDGHTNRGVCDHAHIAEEVANAARRGIRTSVFGVGSDYDDDLLQAVSAAGQGNFYYASSEAQIPEFMEQEINESRQISARSVSLEFELPPGVVATTFNEWPIVVRGRVAVIRLPDLVANQVLEVGLNLEFPAWANQEKKRIGVTLKTDADVMATAELVYETGNDADQPQDDELAEIIANLRLHETTRAAVRLHRAGRRAHAADLFEEFAAELGQNGIATEGLDELFRLASRRANHMRENFGEKERKSLSHSSTMGLRSRSESSRPRRDD